MFSHLSFFLLNVALLNARLSIKCSLYKYRYVCPPTCSDSKADSPQARCEGQAVRYHTALRAERVNEIICQASPGSLRAALWLTCDPRTLQSSGQLLKLSQLLKFSYQQLSIPLIPTCCWCLAQRPVWDTRIAPSPVDIAVAHHTHIHTQAAHATCGALKLSNIPL